MHNRDNQYEVDFDCVKHAVRENAGEAATDIFVDHSPAQRILNNSRDYLLDGIDEPKRKLKIVFCVPAGCLTVLLKSFWMETCISSKKRVTHFAKSFFTGSGLHLSAAHLVAPAFRLGSPQLVNPSQLISIKALY